MDRYRYNSTFNLWIYYLLFSYKNLESYILTENKGYLSTK